MRRDYTESAKLEWCATGAVMPVKRDLALSATGVRGKLDSPRSSDGAPPTDLRLRPTCMALQTVRWHCYTLKDVRKFESRFILLIEYAGR